MEYCSFSGNAHLSGPVCPKVRKQVILFNQYRHDDWYHLLEASNMDHQEIDVPPRSDTPAEAMPVPVSASEVVLRIPELLALILEGQGNRTLARMARLATFTHEQSIQRLWGRPTGNVLDKLVRLFPPEKITKRSTGTQWNIHRLLDESDWARFKHYSIHVTQLSLSQFTLSARSFSSFISSGQAIFPRLRVIFIPWPSAKEYPNAEWFAVATPALQILDMSKPALDPPISNIANLIALNSLLQKIPLQTPFLKKLCLPAFKQEEASPPTCTYLVESFGSALHVLNRLERFSWLWTTIPITIFQNVIRTHPRLTQLEFNNAPVLSPGMGISFKSLIRLRLGASTEEAATSWLSRLSYPDRLWGVDLTLVDITPEDEVPSFPQFIQPLSQATNLADIRIEFNEARAIVWAFLEPLLGCSSLSSFYLVITSHLNGLDDATLEIMASSWRGLERFSIIEATSPNPYFEPSVTLYGLSSLATCCPKLWRIELTVSTPYDRSRLEEILHQSWGTWAPEGLNLLYSRFGTQDLVEDDPYQFLSPRNIAHTLRALWPSFCCNALWCSWDDEVWEEAADIIMRERFENVRNEKSRRASFDQKEHHLGQEINQLMEEKDALAQELANLKQELADSRAGRWAM